MLEIQSSSRGQQKFFIFIQKKLKKNFYIYFVLKKYRQVSAIFTDTDTTSRYHKNRPIPPIPISILKYRYIPTFDSTKKVDNTYRVEITTFQKSGQTRDHSKKWCFVHFLNNSVGSVNQYLLRKKLLNQERKIIEKLKIISFILFLFTILNFLTFSYSFALKVINFL